MNSKKTGPSAKWSLGYSHRSEIDHELEGDGDFTVPPAVRTAFDNNPNLPPGVGPLLFTDSARALSKLSPTDPIDGKIPSAARCSVNATAVY